MQDLGDKLRLVITAHRRVKIVGQLFEDLDPPIKKGIERTSTINTLIFSYSNIFKLN